MHAVLRRGVEHPYRWFGRRWLAGDKCWPDDMNTLSLIDGECRTIFRASIEHPLVLAHSDRRAERTSAVGRPAECDVADVAVIHVTPRRIDAACGVRRNRRLAAVADAARQGACCTVAAVEP